MSKLTERTRSVTDTWPAAAELQLAVFRQASVAKRARLLRSLSQTTIQLSRRALREAGQGADERELLLAFVRLNYSRELAEQLREHLSLQGAEKTDMPLPDMSPPDILLALSPVIDAFEQLGVTYHIGGSVASSAHGIPRTTADIDLVADLREEQVKPFVERLQEAYYADERMIRRAIMQRASFNLIHLATMLKVDVFIPKERAFDREAARRASPHALDEAENARLFYLASPEDVILAKLEWYRAGGEASERQWSDVLGVMKVQAQALDRDYLERWAGQLGLSDLLARAMEEAAVSRP
jgi:hypothetical protein